MTDRHARPARIFRDSDEELGYQDQAAEAMAMTWTEWARETLRAQARKDFKARTKRTLPRKPTKKRKATKA